MTPIQERAVQDVKSAAASLSAAREDLHTSIRAARLAEVPLRVLANAAGLSPETVRTIARGGQ